MDKSRHAHPYRETIEGSGGGNIQQWRRGRRSRWLNTSRSIINVAFPADRTQQEDNARVDKIFETASWHVAVLHS